MANPKDSYKKGYADGREHAEHEKRDGVGGMVSDVFTGQMHYKPDGSSEYKEGFHDGREAGMKKK